MWEGLFEEGQVEGAIYMILLPVMFTMLFGFFDACQTARKDYPWTNNRIWDYIKSQGKDYVNWYYGGNDKYPPGNPFRCDFWHFCKHCWTFCLSMIGLSSVLVGMNDPTYAVLFYVFLYGVEGITFTFFYSYWLRTDRNFRWWWNHFTTWGWKTQ